MTTADLAVALLRDVKKYALNINTQRMEEHWLGKFVEIDDVLAALSAALDPAIAERAGEVIREKIAAAIKEAHRQGYHDGQRYGGGAAQRMSPKLWPESVPAARLVDTIADVMASPALLAQNAALRAERDEALMDAGYLRTQNAALGAYWKQEEARAEAAEAERDAMAKISAEAERVAKWERDRAEAAEAQIAALTARVEGLTGALRAIADNEIQSFTLDAKFGGYKLTDNRRYCDAPDVQRLMATARAALSATTEEGHE